MAPGEINCLAPLAVATTILYLLVRPSSATSQECRWPDKKGENIDNEILKVFDNLQLYKEIEDDCHFEVHDIGLINVSSPGEAAAMVLTIFRETKNFYQKKTQRFRLPEEDRNWLLYLLTEEIDQLAPCVTDKAQYKAVTEPISREYRELLKKAWEWGNTACTETVNWAVRNIVQQGVTVSSQRRKLDLIRNIS
uniref:Type I interferon 6 n=2 Tax=Xenopus tropicalis TaxID=8364 RepID=A0A1B1FFP2_XENTR|nr:type I interferon 6 [Xenopus tropicalis]